MKPKIRYQKNTKKRLAKWKYTLLETATIDTRLTDLSVRDTFFEVRASGKLVARTGYSWDGPSGPAIDTENFMRASLFHDTLYQAIGGSIYYFNHGALFPMTNEKRKELRKKADKIMRDICVEDGMSRLRAWWCYVGVRVFARRHAGVK